MTHLEVHAVCYGLFGPVGVFHEQGNSLLDTAVPVMGAITAGKMAAKSMSLLQMIVI